MTRTFDGKVDCPHCGRSHTQETSFERWVRNHNELSSSDGIVRFDLDMLIHRYKTGLADAKGCRDIQCLMFIEVKTFSANPTASQRDTLSMLSQVLRNRQKNMHGDRKGRHAQHKQITKVFSHLLRRDVELRMYGAHLLQFDGTSPADSSRIGWDFIPITVEQLVGLIRFDLDPDSPDITLDHRRRQSKVEPRLFT